jgi:hypothetical protein
LIVRFAQLFLFGQCRSRFAVRKACSISHLAWAHGTLHAGVDQVAVEIRRMSANRFRCTILFASDSLRFKVRPAPWQSYGRDR